LAGLGGWGFPQVVSGKFSDWLEADVRGAMPSETV